MHLNNTHHNAPCATEAPDTDTAASTHRGRDREPRSAHQLKSRDGTTPGAHDEAQTQRAGALGRNKQNGENMRLSKSRSHACVVFLFMLTQAGTRKLQVDWNMESVVLTYWLDCSSPFSQVAPIRNTR